MSNGKMKIKKSVSKRFRITKNGKVLHRSQNMRHLRRNKSKKLIRKYNSPQQLTGKVARKIKKMLGAA